MINDKIATLSCFLFSKYLLVFALVVKKLKQSEGKPLIVYERESTHKVQFREQVKECDECTVIPVPE